jgi:hypothetical protein
MGWKMALRGHPLHRRPGSSRKTATRIWLPSAVLLGLSALGLSAQAADAPMCRNGLFADKDAPFGLARIVGAPRTQLRIDTGKCPDQSDACKGRSYVVPGNTVITADTFGAYTCVYFPNRSGGSAGYIHRDEFTALPAQSRPRLTDWKGEWRNGDNKIRLWISHARLGAVGNAYWPSRNPPLHQFPGGPNLGGFQGTAAPNGSTVEFHEVDKPDRCAVRLTLVEPFLLARDNKHCGGMNVSFSGVYLKVK